MRALFESTEFCIVLVLGTYLLGQWIFKKTHFPLFQPIVVSVTLIIAFLKFADISHVLFAEKTELISFMLGPSVVALGYVLYEQLEYLKGNVTSILVSIGIGSIVGIISVILLSKLVGFDDIMIYSLEPKSVTMPIAMSISKESGGDVSLTVVFVMFCGIFGSIVGPSVLKLLRINSSIAKGLALGASAHGIGTAKAIEMGALEGAIGGLAIGLMGIATALLIPIFHQIIG